ncbi:DUF1576 domain-containing protein [Anoxynatronum sibiricum]|uniref:DUF1576 domain-containing protein n=1 Tax=Anoxynatronum sibiricum TaxID=210623 RepID=A0ABU9VPW6_9CLOT
MEKSAELTRNTQLPTSEEEIQERKGFVIVGETVKYRIVTAIACILLLSSIFFNTPSEILTGMTHIVVAPSILVTDYLVVGNIGAAFFNSGLLMLAAIAIAHRNEINMNGPVMAAVFTVAGFALFGKNIYNVWAIMGGVLLHARYQQEKFSKFILIAFFGTALGPLISQITFGLGLSPALAFPAGILAGIIAGFCLPPLANHFVKFHQGFNLYNIGFTAGVTGMFFMAVMRAFDFQNPTTLIVAEGFNRLLGTYLFIFFTGMLITGFYFSRRVMPGLTRIWRQSGRLVSDFVTSNGFGASMMNMALLGYISTGYVLIVGGQLNGPTIGGIFTIVGFGAFGKHVKNILPVLAGVYLASLVQVWEVNATGALLAALFGTTLAPIAGYYGWGYGIIAGFFHMSVVMNVGYLHGGMNLYNNGFSGGFVAAVLVPIFDSLKKSS